MTKLYSIEVFQPEYEMYHPKIPHKKRYLIYAILVLVREFKCRVKW